MTELEEKLLAENEELRRMIATLKRRIEIETTPRVEYVDEKTRRFRGGLYKKHEATGYYVRRTALHVDVYKFYHGLDEIPRNYLIHHDGKDENGNYDKEKNDIEYLILMERAAHTALHNPSIGRLEFFTCKICGKVFRARKQGSNRYCSKKCRLAARRAIIHSGKYNEKRLCPVCGKEFEVQKYKTQQHCSNRCGALAQWERQKNAERSDIGKANNRNAAPRFADD